MSNDLVLVIRYGKDSYVQSDRYSNEWRGQLVVNGRYDWPRASGDESFIVVAGPVWTMVRQKKPTTVTVRYSLRPDLACASKASWLTPEQWGALPEADQPLYAPQTETQIPPPEDQPFRVVDGKAQPRRLHDHVVPILPHHVNVYPWFWWTLPCRATGEYAFGELKRRVAALDPAQFDVTVYTNIKTIRVAAHEITLGGARFRPQESLLYIDREKGLPHFDGETADDAIAKAQAWCDEKMAAITAALTVTACPCCQQKLPRGRAAKITAREPGRYRRNSHDIS